MKIKFLYIFLWQCFHLFSFSANTILFLFVLVKSSNRLFYSLIKTSFSGKNNGQISHQPSSCPITFAFNVNDVPPYLSYGLLVLA